MTNHRYANSYLSPSKPMTHEDHIDLLLDQFTNILVPKYMAGAKEHGGKLWEMLPEDLLDNAIEEAVDNLVYLLTLKQRLEAGDD